MEFPVAVAFVTVISGTSLSLGFGIYDAFVWKKKAIKSASWNNAYASAKKHILSAHLVAQSIKTNKT